MRQWKVDPRILCRQHLVAEHNEHHMFLGSLRKKISIDGYIRNGLIEPKNLLIRHDVLVTEMTNRGYKHKTPLPFTIEDIKYLPQWQINYTIDGEASLRTLMFKCSQCRQRYYDLLVEYVNAYPDNEIYRKLFEDHVKIMSDLNVKFN